MGSSIFKDYDVKKENAAAAGPGKLWKIHTAVNKITHAPCSVWAVERKAVEHIPKLDDVWNILKQDFNNLQKLRFPLILSVSKPLEDVKSAIYAETEPINGTIGGLLESKVALDELEIKLGLIQLCEALNFVHTTAQQVHLNLNPYSVVLCNSDWKLAGFAFSVPQSQASQQKAFYDPTPATSFSSDRPTRAPASNTSTEFLKPSLDYAAPELVLLNRISPAADMFALGCLIYELFWLCNFSLSSQSSVSTNSPKKLINASGNVDTYRRSIEEMVPLDMSHIPHDLRHSLESLLDSDQNLRPTAEQLLATDYFNDTAVKILQYLSHINEHDDRSKAEFLKGLKVALGSISFSTRLLEKKILPPLLSELRNTILVPLLLPNIFSIAEMIERNAKLTAPSKSGLFAQLIFPALAPLSALQEPFQITVILLQRLEYMSKRISEQAVTKTLAPMACQALDHTNGAVVVLALKEILPLLPLFDHETIRASLTPRVLNLIHTPQTPQVMRVQALFTMSKLIPFAARQFIEGSVLPSVLRTLSIDKSPTTITSVAGVCDVISIKFGPEYTAMHILPPLFPLLVDAGLARKQFDTLSSIVTGMLSRISDSKRKAFDEAEARANPVLPEGISDAEKLAAFSAQLPSVTAAINPQGSNASLQTNPKAPTHSTTSKPAVTNPSELASSAKGAAAFNALVTSQAQRKQAAYEQKEKSTLVDLDGGFMASVPAVNAPMQKSTSSSSIDADLFSLDTSAFNMDSVLSPVAYDPHTEVFDSKTASQQFSVPSQAFVQPPAHPFSQAPVQPFEEADDPFNPRAAPSSGTKTATAADFLSGTSAQWFLSPPAGPQTTAPASSPDFFF